MGFTHIYTGDGKGKTTAAIGLLIRAIGAGMSVYLGQFFNCGIHSEVKLLNKISNTLDSNQLLTIKQYGHIREKEEKIVREDIHSALSGFEDIKQALFSGVYDLVIADDLNVIINLGIVKEKDIISVIEKNKATEFVLTGRCAKQSIIEKANLVSEIVKIKHYCDDGLIPRLGIDK